MSNLPEGSLQRLVDTCMLAAMDAATDAAMHGGDHAAVEAAAEHATQAVIGGWPATDPGPALDAAMERLRQA